MKYKKKRNKRWNAFRSGNDVYTTSHRKIQKRTGGGGGGDDVPTNGKGQPVASRVLLLGSSNSNTKTPGASINWLTHTPVFRYTARLRTALSATGKRNMKKKREEKKRKNENKTASHSYKSSGEVTPPVWIEFSVAFVKPCRQDVRSPPLLPPRRATSTWWCADVTFTSIRNKTVSIHSSIHRSDLNHHHRKQLQIFRRWKFATFIFIYLTDSN